MTDIPSTVVFDEIGVQYGYPYEHSLIRCLEIFNMKWYQVLATAFSAVIVIFLSYALVCGLIGIAQASGGVHGLKVVFFSSKGSDASPTPAAVAAPASVVNSVAVSTPDSDAIQKLAQEVSELKRELEAKNNAPSSPSVPATNLVTTPATPTSPPPQSPAPGTPVSNLNVSVTTPPASRLDMSGTETGRLDPSERERDGQFEEGEMHKVHHPGMHVELVDPPRHITDTQADYLLKEIVKRTEDGKSYAGIVEWERHYLASVGLNGDNASFTTSRREE